MANLKYNTKEILEELFDMTTGYVMDFSNASFERFVKDVINLSVYNDKGYEEYCSKANKLRQILKNESNIKVAKLVSELLDHYEDYKFKNNDLTEYDKKKISEIKKEMEHLKFENDGSINIDIGVDELIQKISTRNAQFNEMAIDEKLKEIGNLIEYLLKNGKKFIRLDYDKISLGFIKEDDIKNLRKKVQCFRHSSRESILERQGYTENQKQFMVEFGVMICNLIYSEVKSN
ncbi:hypothetical protein [Clostridium cagae]|uniref:hypothetical protein n=1 Tax=Clostridium cagae TaxID=2080751 RepID=UPI000CF60CDD|nr:hypothetical protein [Clostridium cagae]